MDPCRASLLDWVDRPGGLVVGVGNCGREDDGLGWAFVDWLEEQPVCRAATVVRRYQLLLEDADLFGRHDRVLVVDSSVDPAVAAYEVLVPEPVLDATFSSHALSVASVLATARLCAGRLPETRVLAIRGVSFRLHEGLTPTARAHLAAALAFARTGTSTTDPHPHPHPAAALETR